MIVLICIITTIVALMEFILLMFIEIVDAVLDLPKKVRRKIHEKTSSFRNRHCRTGSTDRHDGHGNVADLFKKL